MVPVPPSQRKCSLCCTLGLSSLPLNPAHPSFQVGFPNYHRANSRLSKNQTCLSSSVEQGEHFLCFNKCKVPFVMRLSANFTTPGKFRYDISVLHYAKSPQIPDNRIFTIALVMGSKIVLLLGTWHEFIFPGE